MKEILKKVKNPIKKEIKKFEELFHNIIKSNVGFINHINYYILKRQGKLIRPILVLLTAKMLGTIKRKTYHTACLMELIHTATLIHDDVVDNSTMRRGSLSINSIWKNKVAVLIGDYFLSKSLLLASNNNYLDLLKIICNTVNKMSEGELFQIEKSKEIFFSEGIYNKIIHRKTASLISASCECGAISVNADKNNIIRMKKFGLLAGIAFQIRDDLFDYCENENDKVKIGKPIGIDFREKIITLPLIYAIKKSSYKEKKYIISLIKDNDIKKNKIIINYVKKYGGIKYAIDNMNKIKNNALDILRFYPECTTKNSLKYMMNFIVERKS